MFVCVLLRRETRAYIYILGVLLVSAFNTRLNACLVVGHERGYSSDCTSPLDDVTCERNAFARGGFRRFMSAGERSIGRLRRPEKIY